jgi:MFS family permease
VASIGLVQSRALFQNRWWIVAASLIGNIVGPGPAVIFTVNVFMVPVTTSLGWTRGMFSAGLLASAVASPVMTAVFGYLLDRFGIRRVALPATVFYALALCSFALLTPSAYWALFLMIACSAGFGACLGPIVYSKSIAAWFDKERGLALGIAMAGVGLGVALVPQISARLIEAFGWRMAYVGLGATILILAWIPVTIFVREPSEDTLRESGAARAASNAALPGMTAREAFGAWRFWVLTIAFLLGVAAINGTLTQVVALLTDRGVPVQMAVQALSASGLAIIIGRMLCGWCLDRFHGAVVAICFFIVPMCGIALLASGATGFVPLLGAVLCGAGIGAEVDLMAFFTSRHFGLRAYGKIYGMMFAFFSLFTGVGPYLSGVSFDVYHSYTPIFMIFEGMLVVTCLLFLPLGPYRYPPLDREPQGEESKAIA